MGRLAAGSLAASKMREVVDGVAGRGIRTNAVENTVDPPGIVVLRGAVPHRAQASGAFAVRSSRYASRAGRSGRMSQCGRRVPSGEWRSAGRVSSSHSS